MQERLTEARRGQGELIFLAGEAGIGKTRLLREMTVQGQQAEIRVLEGKCSLFEAALPYAPFVETFRGLLQARTPSEIGVLLGPYAPEVMKLLPELTQLLPDVRPNPSLSPPEEKSRLFESLYQVLRHIATEAPLILSLEDGHWADPSSLELLYFIARRLRRDRWLVIVTYRPEELGNAEGLAQLRQELLRGRLAQEVMLRPLSPSETGEMLKEVLGGTIASPPAFTSWIFHFGEGNPFFTEELVRAIAESEDEPLVQLNPATLSTVTVPGTVREAIMTRLTQLTSAARDVLAAAATLGTTFDLDTLQQTSALYGDEFSRPLMTLLSSQLVRADRTPLRYAFRHHLIREVVVQSLAPDTRRILHQRVGELLERRASPEASPATLLHHFHEAGDRDRTLRYALAAASESSGVYAHQEAARYFALAIEALLPSATRERLRLVEDLGEALYHAGDLDRALDAFETMRECAEVLRMRTELARAYRKIGVMQKEKQGGIAGLPAFEKALSILGETGDPSEEAIIRMLVARCVFGQGKHERGIAEARAAVALAAQAEDPGALSQCYLALGHFLAAQGQDREAQECWQNALALASQAHDLEAELKALNNLGFLALKDTDFTGARLALEQSCEMSKKLGAIPWFLLPYLTLVELSLLEGKWDDAEVLSGWVCAQLEERYGRRWPFPGAAQLTARIQLLRGNRAEAETLLQEARNSADSMSDLPSIIDILNDQARLELQRGNAATARVLLEQAVTVSATGGRAGAPTVESLLLLAEAWVQIGEIAEARGCLERAVQVGPSKYLTPWVFRVRGRIAAQEGSLEDAIGYYQTGLEAQAAAPQPYQAGLLRHQLGVALLRRNKPGDRKAGRAHLADALAVLERLGALPDVELVKQALRRIPGRVPAGHALTKREGDVLVLLAEGLSNAAIAGRLYLSERTVEVHVSHILDKLGLESRTHAAAWAAKHGFNGPPAVPPN